MKISEAKNGKVRYTESKIASGGSRLKTGGGRLKLQRDEPDFMEYLSEKDRRRWDRLSDSKKERILRKAQYAAAARVESRQSGLSANNPETSENPMRTPSVSRQQPVNASGPVNTTGGRINTAPGTRLNNSAAAGAPQSSADKQKYSRMPDRNPGSGRNRQEGTGIPDSGTRRPAASGSSAGGTRINSSSAGSGGFIGLAASAAKKTASKISKALKGKAEQLSGGDDGKNAEVAERAVDEVKTVTNPIKKTVGALFALLAMIVGPFLFILILIILLIVVIVFIVAWIISILFPVAVPRHGDYTVSGMMPYYCQQDDRWGSYPFNGATLYTDGCGMCSMAMVVACLTGDFNITPPTIVDTGYNTVTSHAAQTGIASVYGITDIEQMAGPSKNCCGLSTPFNLTYIQDKIAEGCPIVVSVEGSYLDVTTNGHYFVLYGSGENGVYVYDPATLGRIYQESTSGGGSDWNAVLHDAKHIWIFPAPQMRVVGDSNAEKIFNYLVSAGWSKEASAAAVGNFYQEAGGGGTADINPASYTSGSWGEAGGIAGFTDNGEAGNFTALKDFAAQKGKDWTDLLTQCEFVVYQMSHGKWWGAYYTPTCVEMNEQGYSVEHVSYEEFTRMTDVNEATKAFLCFYEDCGYAMAHYEDVRLPMALQAYAAWGVIK